MSDIISSKTIRTFLLILLWTTFFKYSVKGLGSLKCFRFSRLLIRSWYFRVHTDPWHTNESYQCLIDGPLEWIEHLFFLYLEPPTINTLYGWSGTYGQRVLCSCEFSPVISTKLIIIFSILFSDVSSILLWTFFQNLFHIDMR